MSPGSDPDDTPLARELLAMRSHDEATRARLAQDSSFFRGYHPEMREVHRRNGTRLDAIFDDLGAWPGYRVVGRAGSEAAWFIANHDIASPMLMRRARDLMSDAVDDGQASAKLLAYLVDRIAYFEQGAQIYGTQHGWDNDGCFGIWPPVVDADDVDHRRRLVDLGPLAETEPLTRPDAARPNRLSPEDLRELRRRETEFITTVGWRVSPGSDPGDTPR